MPLTKKFLWYVTGDAQTELQSCSSPELHFDQVQHSLGPTRENYAQVGRLYRSLKGLACLDGKDPDVIAQSMSLLSRSHSAVVGVLMLYSHHQQQGYGFPLTNLYPTLQHSDMSFTPLRCNSTRTPGMRDMDRVHLNRSQTYHRVTCPLWKTMNEA